MKTPTLATAAVALAALLVAGGPGRGEERKPGGGVAAVDTAAAHRRALERAVERGRASLAGMQEKDGHFGRDYPIAITAMAGLALLAASPEPLEDRALLDAYGWLRGQQKDGNWPERQVWVHAQGFATLFLAELYGKALLAKKPPAEIVLDDLRTIVRQACALLVDAQSKSGGWYYTKQPDYDEGSTTVCAVQALRAAKNYGIPVEPKVLERGFAYLKAMQNKDGGFRYAGTQGHSMTSGTAAAVATLVLMQRLDEKVLLDALAFLERIRVQGILEGGHGQYGTFYAAMAMKVIGEEYGEHMPVAAKWTRGVEDALLAEQRPDGSWPSRDADTGKHAYGTALAVISLAAPHGRLSILHRRAPKLPE